MLRIIRKVIEVVKTAAMLYINWLVSDHCFSGMLWLCYLPGDDGLDGVVGAGGPDGEPEDHVNHVNEPDGTVEVEAIAEHELPGTEGPRLEGVDGAHQREGEGDGVEDGGGDPVDAHPGLPGPCNATLALEQGNSWKGEC